jgi:hypothetical protein
LVTVYVCPQEGGNVLVGAAVGGISVGTAEVGVFAGALVEVGLGVTGSRVFVGFGVGLAEVTVGSGVAVNGSGVTVTGM